MSAARVSRGARRFLLVSAASLPLALGADLAGLPRRTLVALGWTLRDNPTGAETGTGEANAERRPVDRFANGFVPLALAYLALGSYETLALRTPLPPVLGPYPPRVSHLLGAGAAALVVFAVGFRLLPRFLVTHPPRALVAVVLPAGAIAPLLLAVSLAGRGALFRAGTTLEAVAVAGFALAFGVLFVRSDRRRVGFYGVLAGAAAGVVAVALDLSLAFGGASGSLVPRTSD